jgi:hypothetical protein
MKKSEPKIILNLSVENSELDEKIKIAIDKYVEQSIYAELDDVIANIIEKRINTFVNSRYNWESESKINGQTFEQFVRSKTEEALIKAIDKNIKEILTKKLTSIL